MRPVFYALPTVKVYPAPSGSDFMERSRVQLEGVVKALRDVLGKIPYEKDTLPVLVGCEDYFGRVSGDHAKVIDRNLAFDFFKDQFSKLSMQYPHVLIIPGSVYLSVQRTKSDHISYRQEGSVIKSSMIYVQNVVPVFYNGSWSRLIKKGEYLYGKIRDLAKTKNNVVTVELKTQGDFDAFLLPSSDPQKVKCIEVPLYHEDAIDSINPGLIFFGKTPLPDESQLLSRMLDKDFSFFSPVFQVGGLWFGVHICADYAYRPGLERDKLDVHLLISDGQRKSPGDRFAEMGAHYAVQVDPSLVRYDVNIAGLPLSLEVAQENRLAKAGYWACEQKHSEAVISIAGDDFERVLVGCTTFDLPAVGFFKNKMKERSVVGTSLGPLNGNMLRRE